MGVDNSTDSTVTTGVDTLLSLLKKKKKIGLDEASKELRISQEVLQTWVDFLVEERVIGTEYKFTKPFIYLNEEGNAVAKAKNLTEAKLAHFEELRKKGVSEEEGEYFWKDKMLAEVKKQKEYFFINQEVTRIKDNQIFQKDDELKKAGFTKNYLEEVENLLASKKLQEAKVLLADLESKIKPIKDEVVKNKAYAIRTEVKNAIDLSEKIENNKKELELRLKGIKENKNKSFFEDEEHGDKTVLQKLDKGIKSQSSQPQAFFTSQPTKLTVVQHIVTPDQPIPSSKQQSTQQAGQQTLQEGSEQVVQQTIAMPQVVPTPMPVAQATLQKNYEEEFSKIRFVLNELHTLLEEKDLSEAKNEYSRARTILEGLPESEQKHQMSDELFKAYHLIKELEKTSSEAKHKDELFEKERMRKEQEARIEEIERENREREKALIEQLNKQKHEEIQQQILEAKHESVKKGEIPQELHDKQKELNVMKSLKISEPQTSIPNNNNSINNSIKEIKKENEKTNSFVTTKPISESVINVKDSTLPVDLEISEPNDEELERKERRLLNDVHHIPIKPKTITNVQIIQPKVIDQDKIEEEYHKGVSLLYNGNISEARSIFQGIIQKKPYHMAARIRLKECNNAN